MKKVSIIIPVYNVVKYLALCMNAVIAQTYRELEIILVDDGSTDESGALCDGYAASDPRVTVIHQQNAGAANAKNAGLDRATGEYITFIDSDDYVERNWIETLVNTAEKYEADVVECDFDKVYQNRIETVKSYTEMRLFTAEEYLQQYLDNWICSLFWNKLFSRKMVEDVRFRKERRCIDDEFFTYKAVSGAGKVAHIPNILYHYRQRASSAVSSEKNRLQITDDSLEVLIERYQWVYSCFPRLRKDYLIHDVQIMFYFSKAHIFTKNTVKKFRSISRYYAKESLLHCGMKAFLYALRLQLVRLNCAPKRCPTQTSIDLTDYFS